MAEIGLYLLKEFPYNTSVIHNIQFQLASYNVSHHVVFHYIMSDASKHDDSTTDAHIKHIVELFQNIIVLFANMSTIWDNTDGCTEQ